MNLKHSEEPGQEGISIRESKRRRCSSGRFPACNITSVNQIRFIRGTVLKITVDFCSRLDLRTEGFCRRAAVGAAPRALLGSPPLSTFENRLEAELMAVVQQRWAGVVGLRLDSVIFKAFST